MGNLDVKVKIDLAKPIGKVGFGIPLILEENATTKKSYTECESLADVVTAGFAATSTVYKAANLIFMQEDAPKTIAVCATDETAQAWLGVADNVAESWRQLIVVTESETETSISGIMTAIETLDGKMYYASLAADDSTTLTVANINRTVLFYCSGNSGVATGYEVAALVGATAGKNPGSITYKNQVLKGISPQSLTNSQIKAIHDKGGLTFVTKAGDNVTTEGKVASGEYIDIIDSQDYVIQQLEYKTQKILNNSGKIPYDNNGIAMLEAVAVEVLKDAYNNGIIAEENGKPAYTINYALREDTTESDRKARKYAGGQFRFKLSGAVHTVEITGEITV